LRRVLVLGLDAMSPKVLLELVRRGSLPNLARLLRVGGFSKALPALPAQTPENWTTVATGAWPGTHGVAVWGRHDPGQPVTERHSEEAMSSNLCKAEYLWEALARQGLRSVLLYFVGYPPTCEGVVHVDWFWKPGDFYFELCSAACYSTYVPEGLRGAPKRVLAHLRPIRLRRAEGWASLPESCSEPLEAEVRVEPRRPGRPVTYHVLVVDSRGEGYDTCLICRSKDASKALCELRVGEWSPWLREEFVVKGARVVGTVRFKLVELSPNGSRLRLYRSQVYPVGGFSHPPEASAELVERFGPYVNEASARLFLSGLIDESTFVEEMSYQIDWIARAARYLVDKFEASLFMMHWHLLDTLQHRVLGLVDPAGGKYDPAKAGEAWRLLELGYKLADELVGRFMEMLDGDTYLLVVSDHGNVPNRKVVSVVNALAKAGLVALEEVGGELRVDWSRSKVFVDLTHVYVNLRSRYPGGVVDDSEYEEVRRRVFEVLRELRDDEGEFVVAFALRREDAAMIGLWGPHVGDVVFAYSPGFTWGHYEVFEGARVAGGANHGPQIPTAETSVSSNYGVFIMAGPGVKRGYVRPTELLGPVYLVDVAPTVAHVLGVEPPRHCQGRVLYDFFEGWDASEARRERVELDFPEPLVPIVGDVTDAA